MKLVYEEIGPISRAKAEAAFEHNDAKVLRTAVLSVALHEPDRVWAQAFCVRLAFHQDEWVRGNALLGFGHLARIHGTLDLEVVVPLVTAGLADTSAVVRGQACDAVDDIKHYLGVTI